MARTDDAGAGHCPRGCWTAIAGAPDPRTVLAHGAVGEEDRAMVMVVTTVAVAPGREEEWEAVWRQVRRLAAAYPGFRRTTLWRDPTRPGQYVVQSEWDSRSDFDRFVRISGVEWLNRGLELWTGARPQVYDEVVDALESTSEQ